jgi:phosphohistidine phosphatase
MAGGSSSIMRIYLIRHADAVEAEDDSARALSPRGVRQTRDLARFLKPAGRFEPDEIWHSPLVRSRQTAELLRKHLHLAAPLALVDDLKPEDDPQRAARRVRAAGHTVAVVGHEPHLSALASLLVAGKAAPPVFVMKKAAVLALEGAGPHWMVRWHWSPKLIA